MSECPMTCHICKDSSDCLGLLSYMDVGRGGGGARVGGHPPPLLENK